MDFLLSVLLKSLHQVASEIWKFISRYFEDAPPLFKFPIWEYSMNSSFPDHLLANAVWKLGNCRFWMHPMNKVLANSECTCPSCNAFPNPKHFDMPIRNAVYTQKTKRFFSYLQDVISVIITRFTIRNLMALVFISQKEHN